MTEDEVANLIAIYLDKKVTISASGRVANREKLARHVVKMANRLIDRKPKL